jgi:protein TonB
MNKYFISIIALFAALPLAQAQVKDTISEEPVIESVDEAPPAMMMEGVTDYVEDYAVAVEEPAPYEPLNQIKYNYKIKTVPNPDKKAYYSQGVHSMLENIYLNLRMPYYGSSNNKLGDAQFVLLQVTIGKDSSLYNVETLSTPGSSYTSNARECLENLPYRFVPATKNGKPVDSILIIPFRFEGNLDYYQFGVYNPDATR